MVGASTPMRLLQEHHKRLETLVFSGPPGGWHRPC